MGRGFENLVVWAESARLAAAVVEASRGLRGPASRDLTAQMVRAAESVPANIAEGYGRGLTRDGLRFLRIARASAIELESHVRVATMSHRLRPDVGETVIQHCRRVRYLLFRFERSVMERMSHR